MTRGGGNRLGVGMYGIGGVVYHSGSRIRTCGTAEDGRMEGEIVLSTGLVRREVSDMANACERLG